MRRSLLLFLLLLLQGLAGELPGKDPLEENATPDTRGENGQKIRKFSFFDAPLRPGSVAVGNLTRFTIDQGYGLEPQKAGTNKQPKSTKSLQFSVLLSPGNYQVKCTFLGDGASAAAIVQAEGRRVLSARLILAPEQEIVHTSIVHVRSSKFPDGNPIATKMPGGPGWDNKLTLEISSSDSALRYVEIAPAPAGPTIFLARDSTVADQPAEPTAGWGQLFPMFVKPDACVANYAGNGLSLATFRSGRRWEKILSQAREGDYVLLQFGHNDQKEPGPLPERLQRYRVGLKRALSEVRAGGVHPVVITPMERRRFSGGKPAETLTDYARAAREVAAEESVPLVDLHRMSLEIYAALGETGSVDAFCHFPAGRFPGRAEAISDNTHPSMYGAWQLSKAVTEGLRRAVPLLAPLLMETGPGWSPRNPDRPETSPFAQN